MKPRIGLLLGDPNGIGPELAAKLLADPELAGSAEVTVIADAGVFAAGQAVACVSAAGDTIALLDEPNIAAGELSPGTATAAGGRYMLAAWRLALDMSKDGEIDAICFAPLNKSAMTLGDAPFDDELHFIADHLGFTGRVGEINTQGGLWTSRVTSHVPLADVAGLITRESVFDNIEFLDETLKSAGYAAPRVGIAALNPHAGDDGLFGREEIDIIGPAVERAQGAGIDAAGPYPSDTVFVRARAGAFDAVVTMYHDQGQIAMKLMGFERGVTILGGLPVPITTPASGSAYDIVGENKADPTAMKAAFELAVKMSERRRAAA